MIKSEIYLQEYLDKLINQLQYVNNRIDSLEFNVSKITTSINAFSITLSSLIQLLIEKEIITDKELTKIEKKTLLKLKKTIEKQNKEAEKEAEKINKQIFYDALLKINNPGNA